MKALIYEGPERLVLREVPDAMPGPGEELIRISAVGICGSDMHAWQGHDARRPAPLVLGHEAAGVIVGGAQAGARVTINPLVSCGACAPCRAGRENLCPDRQIISLPPREGAFAEYVAMPARNLVRVPPDVALSRAALAEPLAVSWHAVRLARAARGTGVPGAALVIGGGAIGVAAALALAAHGVTDVTLTEPNPARRAYLAGHCDFRVLTDADGPFGLVIDAVGLAATRAVASTRVAPGGVIAHIGLAEGSGGLDVRRMTLHEVTLIGTYTYTAQDFRDTAQALFDGRLGRLDWTETRPLSEGARAFADLDSGRVAAPKIILEPWG